MMAERKAYHFPLLLDLDGRRVVVIGGGAVAERKVRSVLDCGAVVTVVAPELTVGLRELASSGRLKHEARAYRPGDLDGAALAFVAVGDPEVSAEAAKDAEAAGVLVNVVDRPEECRFIVPSVLRRGHLTIAISTGGASPAWARKIRERLEGEFGEEYEKLLDAAARVRKRCGEEIPDPARRREALSGVAGDPLLDLARSSSVEELEREMESRQERPGSTGAGLRSEKT
jgi:precorrin-2 dehydrogenase/sirohydrochlorin ferrochelatase